MVAAGWCVKVVVLVPDDDYGGENFKKFRRNPMQQA